MNSQNIWRTTLFSIFLCLFLCSTRVEAQLDPQFSLVVDGRTRLYRVHLPTGHNPNTPTPLLLLLHGGGTQPDQSVLLYRFNQISDRENFIVVYPQGTAGNAGNYTWNAGNCCGFASNNRIDDVKFFRLLIEKLKQDYNIDNQKVFVAGNSNGAFMTYRLGCELSDKIAAIGISAGAFNLRNPLALRQLCKTARPLPVIKFHGLLDQQVLYQGGSGSAQTFVRYDNPVSRSVQFWRGRNGCSSFSTIVSQSGNIVTDTWTNCTNGANVVLYTIRNAGHSWAGSIPVPGDPDPPTQEISASELMWTFFQSHPMPAN